MGFMKKFGEKMAAKAMANAPDFEEEIRRLLEPGEELAGWGFGYHASPNLNTSGGVGGNKLIGAAINAASEARQKAKHMSGDANSCAFAIPRDMSWAMAIAVTDRRLGFLDFGMANEVVPPKLLVSFPRTSVSSVRPTGEAAKLGEMVRFSFADNSHVDVSVYDWPGKGPVLPVLQALGS
jgi:hypothetical protein